jgi:hypothetical protein
VVQRRAILRVELGCLPNKRVLVPSTPPQVLATPQALAVTVASV